MPTLVFASPTVYNVVEAADFNNIIRSSHKDTGSVDGHSKLNSPPAKPQLIIVFVTFKN